MNTQPDWPPIEEHTRTLTAEQVQLLIEILADFEGQLYDHQDMPFPFLNRYVRNTKQEVVELIDVFENFGYSGVELEQPE